MRYRAVVTYSVTVACVCMLPFSAEAATKTWDGGGAGNNCSTAGNWSGDTMPQAGDDIIFNGTSTKNATWDAGCPSSVSSFLMDTGYTGTVTVATVYSSGFTELAVTGNVTINKGVLSHTDNSSTQTNRLKLSVGGDMTVGSNGSITVSGLGFDGGACNTSGYGTGAGSYYSTSGGGAGHGGAGGSVGPFPGSVYAAGGATYGSQTEPTALGSGGAGGSAGNGNCPGGSGGGAVYITVVGAFSHAGSIVASGIAGTVFDDGDGGIYNPGAGAGGSIYVSAGSMSGNGSMTANGGTTGVTSGATSPYARGGGGGGGRIALYYESSTSTYTTSIAGGTGNGGTYNGSSGTFYEEEVDATAPTVTNVTSDKTNGTYTVGEIIDIDVTFSEAVTSVGNVTVTLETGTTDRTCTFTLSSTTSGTCNYTVQAGDTTSDLTVNSITGTVADAASNTLTVPATPATNLAANKALAIDTTAPDTPVATPVGGTFSSSQAVTLVSAGSSAMYYTIDGTTPTVASTLYVGAITVASTMTLKAIAVDDAQNESAVMSESYTIQIASSGGEAASTPTFIQSGGVRYETLLRRVRESIIPTMTSSGQMRVTHAALSPLERRRATLHRRYESLVNRSPLRARAIQNMLRRLDARIQKHVDSKGKL